MTFGEFWKENEAVLAAKCYVNGVWKSPYEIAKAVYELLENEGT